MEYSLVKKFCFQSESWEIIAYKKIPDQEDYTYEVTHNAGGPTLIIQSSDELKELKDFIDKIRNTCM